MKKILMALAVIAVAYTGAQAQAKKTNIEKCGVDEKQVCKEYNGSKSCYPSNFAQNYKVCKGANGYYVCCLANQPANPAYTSDVLNISQYQDKQVAAEPVNYNVTDNSAPEKEVCRKNGDKTTCYKSSYAQNYKVCKGESGYYICGEE